MDGLVSCLKWDKIMFMKKITFLARITKWGANDESIISVFNIIFESV